MEYFADTETFKLISKIEEVSTIISTEDEIDDELNNSSTELATLVKKYYRHIHGDNVIPIFN